MAVSVFASGCDLPFYYDSYERHERTVLVYYIVHPYLYLLYSEYLICVMAWPRLDQGTVCRFVFYDFYYAQDRIVLVYCIVYPYLPFCTTSALFVWWPWQFARQRVICRFSYDSCYTHERSVLVYYIVHPYLCLPCSEYLVCVTSTLFVWWPWPFLAQGAVCRFFYESYYTHDRIVLIFYVVYPYLTSVQRVPFLCDGRDGFRVRVWLAVFFITIPREVPGSSLYSLLSDVVHAALSVLFSSTNCQMPFFFLRHDIRFDMLGVALLLSLSLVLLLLVFLMLLLQHLIFMLFVQGDIIEVILTKKKKLRYSARAT